MASGGQAPHGMVAGDNRLYRNNGNGTFTEVAASAGVQYGSSAADSIGGAWGDYDLDGWLDLVACAYGPLTDQNRLYHNKGNGTFEDVAQAGGARERLASQRTRASLTDMNGDRYPELILTGDTGTSRYYANDGDGTFTDSTHTVQDLDRPNGIGIATGDFDGDGDGDLDFCVSDVLWPLTGTGGNRLYWNQGDHIFAEGGRAAGVYECGWGWGLSATDIDNDGLLDLAATNGWAGSWANYPTRLFHNQGGDRFLEVAGQCGIRHTSQGRSLLRLDADHDGDEDLVITAMVDALAYYRNDLGGSPAWLDVVLRTAGNRRLAPGGIGTTVRARVGSQEYLRHLDSNQSYIGQSEMCLHFGLGQAALVDELRVEWSDGFTTVLRDVAVNQRIAVDAVDPLEANPLVRGRWADLRVRCAEPGETAYFVCGVLGPGRSRPVSRLGGLHFDLRPPLAEIGHTHVAASRTATFTVYVPARLPAMMVFLQAGVRRGWHGSRSVKTNVVTAAIL